jgi:hypothetical protein
MRRPFGRQQKAHGAAVVWSKLLTFKRGHRLIQSRPLASETGQKKKIKQGGRLGWRPFSFSVAARRMKTT